MPVAKLSASGSPNTMKSVEGNDSLDTIIGQAIGKEPLHSFPRTGDSPVQLYQLLNALDAQDLPSWSLFTPPKVPMQKCEKCSWEFCSPINYRRHIRMHRRSLNVDKGSHKNRDLLGAFWDKLSLEEAKEVASFEDVSLKEVSGSSVVKALAISLHKPGVWTLPQVYVTAGSILLDIIQAKSSRLPISSQELFSILDDASERTFLFAGTAESVQKYVIEGEAEKALELKNLVACASLLFEQKLVKAWLADKDAEALRCQKLLVEEEEASQKRQAQLLERKKQRKLRQKEQKEREKSNNEEADTSADSVNGVSAETSISPVSSDHNSNAADTLADMTSCLDWIQYSTKEDNEDAEAQSDLSIDHIDVDDSFHNVDSPMESPNGHRHFTINKWQVAKSQRTGRNGFHTSQNLQAFKLEPVRKQGSQKDRSTLPNGGKVWTRKPRVKIDDESSRLKSQKVATHEVEKRNCELMIGSISVQVSNCIAQQQHSQRAPSDCSGEHVIPGNSNVPEKILNSDAVRSGKNREVAKLWRHVGHSEIAGPQPVQRGMQDSEEAVTCGKIEDHGMSNGICLQKCAADTDDSNGRNYCSELVEQPEGLLFSSDAVKAFLAQRWKEAILSDHVKLVLSPESENSQNDSSVAAPSSNIHNPSILGDAENRSAGAGAPVSSINENAKAKLRMKPEKGVTKIKYIPKQRVLT